MKSLKNPEPAVLFTAVLAQCHSQFTSTAHDLCRYFGPAISMHPPAAFHYTSYYHDEMGKNLLKGFIGFKKLLSPEQLVRAKLFCRHLEWQSAVFQASHISRGINIDPGIVTLANVTLATSKNFAHLMYLGHFVYGEVTLMYHPKGWETLPWTYPDYKIESVQEFLIQLRNYLKAHRTHP